MKLACWVIRVILVIHAEYMDINQSPPVNNIATSMMASLNMDDGFETTNTRHEGRRYKKANLIGVE